jgi:uncharacterized membrane protein YhhN
MASAGLIVFTALMLIPLLATEGHGGRRQRATLKGLASAGFVTLAALRYSGTAFDTWVLAAIVAGAVGDVLLVFDETFDLGLIAFLGGHLLLIGALHGVLDARRWSVAPLVPTAVLGVFVLRWLWPHLERRKASVSLYVAVVSVMVWAAAAVTSAGLVPWWCLLAAILFMVSDVLVARHRFVRQDVRNRLVGLPLYYAAQVLFALLVGL